MHKDHTLPKLEDYIELENTVFHRRQLPGWNTVFEHFSELVPLLIKQAGGEPSHEDPRKRYPQAYIDPRAYVDPNAYVAPRAKVHGTSVLKAGTIVDADAIIGNNCELGATYVGPNSILGHQVTATATVIGANVHIGAVVTVGSIDLTNPDIHVPVKPIRMRFPDGTRLSLDRTKFGMVLGDGARMGMHIVVDPGTFVGKDTFVFGPGRLPAAVYPGDRDLYLVQRPEITVRERGSSKNLGLGLPNP